MKNTQAALLLYPQILFAAEEPTLVTYAAIGEPVGISPLHMGGKLEPLYAWCRMKGLPVITMIVTLKGTKGRVGMFGITDEEAAAEQAKVFAFDWRSIAPPTHAELVLAMSIPSCRAPVRNK